MSAAFSSSSVSWSRLGGLVVAHAPRPGDERAVRGHLVVLGALAGGNQTRVHRGIVEVLFHDRLAFFDDPGDAVAVLAAHFLVEALEHLLEPLDVSARLLEMRLERRAQIRRRGRLRQLRQRLGQLFLGIVGVAQFVEKRIVQGSASAIGRLLMFPCSSVVCGELFDDPANRVPGFMTTLMQSSSFSRNVRTCRAHRRARRDG